MGNRIIIIGKAICMWKIVSEERPCFIVYSLYRYRIIFRNKGELVCNIMPAVLFDIESQK